MTEHKGMPSVFRKYLNWNWNCYKHGIRTTPDGIQESYLINFWHQPFEALNLGTIGVIKTFACCFSISELTASCKSRISSTHWTSESSTS